MIKVIDNILKFVEEDAKAVDRALNRMAIDIERYSKATVPVKMGQLRSTGRHVRVGFLNYRTEYNKEYAAFQEWGGDPDRGIVVRHYTTPGTGKFYLKHAGDRVKKDAINYLRQEVRGIKV